MSEFISGFSKKPLPSDDVYQVLYDDEQCQAPEGRVLYLSRHGESEHNLYGKIGGNSPLSIQGEKYSDLLATFFNMNQFPNSKVWTSELIRTHQTAKDISSPKFVFPQLNEINSGDHDDMTYEEIALKFPVEFAKRDQDKLRYRYPNGESYLDVCKRLTEILPDMNKSENLLVISHQAVIRCILAFMMKTPLEELPYIQVPLHTILKLTMSEGENSLEFIRIAVDCVDTYRAKPSNCEVSRNLDDAIQSVPYHL